MPSTDLRSARDHLLALHGQHDNSATVSPGRRSAKRSAGRTNNAPGRWRFPRCRVSNRLTGQIHRPAAEFEGRLRALPAAAIAAGQVSGLPGSAPTRSKSAGASPDGSLAVNGTNAHV